MVKFSLEKGFGGWSRGLLGAFGGPRGLQEGSKRALEGLLGASWALQEAKQSFQEGSLIVLELQVDLVSRKTAPQEAPKRAPKGPQQALMQRTPALAFSRFAS